MMMVMMMSVDFQGAPFVCVLVMLRAHIEANLFARRIKKSRGKQKKKKKKVGKKIRKRDDGHVSHVFQWTLR